MSTALVDSTDEEHSPRRSPTATFSVSEKAVRDLGRSVRHMHRTMVNTSAPMPERPLNPVDTYWDVGGSRLVSLNIASSFLESLYADQPQLSVFEFGVKPKFPGIIGEESWLGEKSVEDIFRAAVYLLAGPIGEPPAWASDRLDPKEVGTLSTQDDHNWLAAANTELRTVDEEANLEGFQVPSDLSKRNAQHILQTLAPKHSTLGAPAVYPTPDGEVAIFFQKKRSKSGVLILCDPSGGGACFLSIAGKKSRARFDDVTDLLKVIEVQLGHLSEA